MIIAPSITPEAARAVAGKKNVRLLECGEWGAPEAALDFKRVNGGLLVQDRDIGMIGRGDLKTVSRARAQRAGTWRPAVRLAGGQVRQVQRHRLRQ